MTKKKIARTNRGTKRTAVRSTVKADQAKNSRERVEPTPAPTPPESRRPTAFQLTETVPFDGDEMSGATTAADLFSVMWEAPNRNGCGRSREGFIEDVLRCVADEIAVVESAVLSGDIGRDALGRFLLRANWRIRTALEVNRRMALEAGEVES